MPPPMILDPASFPVEALADVEGIRQFNRQRFEMEQLTAICLIDRENWRIAGYLDVPSDVWWARGHMPGAPLMPGVLMCECAAQLCSYFISSGGMIGPDEFMGFGGMDEVRFRGAVLPGDRLHVVAEATRKVKSKRLQFLFQGIVRGRMVFDGTLNGVVMSMANIGASD